MPDEIDCSNSKYVVVDGMYRSYFYVDADGYPTNVLAGWYYHNFTNDNDMVDVDIEGDEPDDIDDFDEGEAEEGEDDYDDEEFEEAESEPVEEE